MRPWCRPYDARCGGSISGETTKKKKSTQNSPQNEQRDPTDFRTTGRQKRRRDEKGVAVEFRKLNEMAISKAVQDSGTSLWLHNPDVPQITLCNHIQSNPPGALRVDQLPTAQSNKSLYSDSR